MDDAEFEAYLKSKASFILNFHHSLREFRRKQLAERTSTPAPDAFPLDKS